MKTRINKRWLINGIITTMLFGIVMVPVIKDEIKVKTEAATNDPVLVWGPAWDNNSNANTLVETTPGSHIYTKTFTALKSDRYQLVKKGTWNRYPAFDYDGNSSKPGRLAFPVGGAEEDFYLLNSGDVTITMYNPYNLPGSPAGPRRFTVNMANSAQNAQSHLVLGGDAVSTGWATNIGTNRLKSEGGFDGQYLSIVQNFNTKDFKVFIWDSAHLGNWGWAAYDSTRSNANSFVSQSGENIHVNTANFYKVVFDTKLMKIFFHTETTTHKVVSKYDGATLLEKEAAFSGINYTPTPISQPNKRFEGWYTDAAFNNAYTPGTVSSDISLYGKYVAEQDVRLSFFDRNQAISTGDVYVYGWNPYTLGNWPGTKMKNHGMGYHSVDIPLAKLCGNIVFNNGMSGGAAGGEVKTGDLTWGPGKNIYIYDTNQWGTISAARHSAILFGIRVLSETGEGCSAQSSTILSSAWTKLSTEFALLASDAKTDLKNTTANVSGDLAQQGTARYDFIAQKYSFNDFIERTTPPPSGVREPQPKIKDRFIAISVIVGFALVTLISASAIRKRRYH